MRLRMRSLAIGVAMAMCLSTVSSAQAPVRSQHRELVVAGVLGIFPGLGHVYAAEPVRGLAVFGVWFVGGFAALNSSNKAVSNVGGVLLLGSSAFSIIDAVHAAQRFNRRRGGRHADVRADSSERGSSR